MANYVIRLIVDNRQARTAIGAVTRETRELERQMKKTEAEARRLGGAMSAMMTAALATQFIKLSDTYTSIANKLKTVSNGHDDLASNMQRTFDMAQENRVSWESLAKTYSRIQRSTRELRLSQNEVANITDTLTKAIQLSGATTAETNGVLIQFGQALSKGKLDGDEFKSVMENSVEVGNILTKSLGVTRGELMKMSKAGQITTSVIVKAFQEARSEIVERFGDAVPTIGQRFTQLRNAIVKAVGESNGVLKPFGDLLGVLTKHADLLVLSLTTLGSVVLAVKVAQGAMAATRAMQVFLATMSTNPVVAMAVAIGGLVLAAQQLEKIGPQTQVKKLGMGGTLLQAPKDAPGAGIRGSFTEVMGTMSGKNVIDDLEANLARLKKAIDEALDITPMERFISWASKLVFAADGMRAHFETMAAVSTAMTRGVTEAVIKNVERAVKEAEKARREAEAFKTKFESFHGALNPAARAAYELAEGLDTLNEAIRRNTIDVAQAQIIWEQYRETLAGVNQVASGANVTQAVDIANPDGFGNTRRQLAPSFLPSTSLPQASVDRTDLLLGQDAERTKINAGLEKNFELSKNQAQILEELRGKEQDRMNRLVAMNSLLANQTISQAEYNKLLKQLTDQDMVEGVKRLDEALVLVFDNATDALADFLYTGEFGFKKMVDSMLRDVSRLLAQQLIMGALGAASGASYGNWIGTGAAMLGQKGFANGGTYTVGGAGGTDSQIVAMRATPGESIQVATPEQQRRGGGSSAGAKVTINNTMDPRQMAAMIDTPAGHRAIQNVIRVNPGIISRRAK